MGSNFEPFWFLCILSVFLFVLGVVLIIKNIKKKSIPKIFLSTIPIIVAVLLVVIPIIAMISFGKLDYRDDLIVKLPASEVTLVIKEWSWLLDSGADVYYLDGKYKEIKLGETGGGDDGYCPFADGQYEIINNGDGTFTIKWGFHQNSDIKYWKEAVFNVPE